ncbi:MAG: hypothetical protein Q8K02_00585, partial [Flavobacterium sp.]|nr:hypothetical protein [Flavobacterium sp.]
MFRAIKMYIRSPGGNDSQPSTIRVFSYKNFFEKNYIAECCLDVSVNKSTFYIWILCILGRYDAVLLSMPPFRGWGLLFLPFTRVILDVRDGWSIAMGSGYGGNLPPKPFKAKIARLVEKFAIRRSFVSITCTKGLQEYLQNVSGRQVLLVPNGVACDDLDLILNIKHNVTKVNFSDELIFCCAGQFSEYGKIKVE